MKESVIKKEWYENKSNSTRTFWNRFGKSSIEEIGGQYDDWNYYIFGCWIPKISCSRYQRAPL